MLDIVKYTKFNIQYTKNVYLKIKNTLSSHNCFSVANYIIDIYKEKTGTDISIIQLLKYQFICYGWYLAYYNKKLFKCTIKTYPLGPIIIEIYKGFDRSYRNDFYIVKEHKKGNKHDVSQEIQEFIQEVMEKYKKIQYIELSDILHLSDTPWTETIIQKGIFAKIDNTLIKRYYRILLAEKNLY